MKATLLFIGGLLALTSCTYEHKKPFSPEGSYNVSTNVVKTNCAEYNQTGKYTFVIYPVGDFDTNLQIVGWNGVCELDNQSSYLTSYAQSCHFKNESGNDVEAQFSLYFSGDDLNGDATLITSCTTEYSLLGHENK